MDTQTTAAELKRLSLLKNDGLTAEVRGQAAGQYAALKAALRAEMEKPKSWKHG